MDHARPPPESFSATRRRAERARGLAAISAADGSTGLRVRSRSVAARSSARGGAWRDGPGVRPGAGAHEFLDRAVLQRMEGDDGEPAARRQHLLGGGEAALELAQLVVHGDAQRLEGARRRIALVPGRRPDGAAHDLGQLARGLDALVAGARSTMARATRRLFRSSP